MSATDAASTDLDELLTQVPGIAAAWIVADRSQVPAGADGWLDAAGSLRAAYGIAPTGLALVVLDVNLRIVGTTTGTDVVGDVRTLLAQSAPSDDAVVVAAQAPVLFVPDAIPDALRTRLIDVWETSGAADTGVEKSADSGRLEALDDGIKRRRDHTVTDAALLREISSAVGRRVLPEVQHAFAFRATRFEGFKIACYDASTGGFFRSHRDNLSPSTAHRVFGLTLNLNDDYAGGELRFPEYGKRLHRPPAGAALVFSCSLLHEALDVTDGRRFVLLSFLYGDDAR